MPPRISRSSAPKFKSMPSGSKTGARKPHKAQKRALNAFSIASHEHAERPKIRKSRLGDSEYLQHRKRPRDDEEDEEDDEEESEVKRGKRRRGADEDLDEGSDSDGNTWTMGHVDEDDDSDIDSDEAFGESDEEKFEGWTFRGSSTNQKGRKPQKTRARQDDEDEEIDLDDDENMDGEEDEEDDLGEDAIDLATALDEYEESSEGEDERQTKRSKSSKAKAGFGDNGMDLDEDSESSSDDDEDEANRRAQLNGFISMLAADDASKQTGPRKAEIHESGAPSEFGVSRKIDLASLKPKIVDADKKKALKLLQDDKPSKRNDIAKKLSAPLPKRQQDKLDRAAASAKAKETLDRWTDTVKQNRRAEHLSFPLNQPEDGSRMGESRFLPTTTANPTNELESTIQNILRQSGLSNGKEDEEKFAKWEELQTNKLPLQEVEKRRAQLRMERELLFREEVRAKRIKKIKSKAYRRVHRKERERLMERERDALKADGVEISEDEREYNDRRRAEERMGAKHRDSKWAKGIKATGRAAWDDDARSGVTEMARRNDELRRRMEGKEVRGEDDDASDLSSQDEDDMDDDDNILQHQLGRLKENPFSTKHSKLGSMAFIQKSEAAKRARNEEDIERLRKELAGEESGSEDDENSTKRGRRKFGPSSNTAIPAIQVNRGEFEERDASDDEDLTMNNAQGNRKTLSSQSAANEGPSANSKSSSQNPYLVKAKSNTKTEAVKDLVPQAYDSIAAMQAKPSDTNKLKSKSKSQSVADHGLAGNPNVSAPDNDGWQTVTYENGDSEEEDDIENEGIDLDVVLRNQQLTASAFAGDDVEKEFDEEKKAIVADEDEKIEKDVLPGWGAWTGEGLTKNERRRKGEVSYRKKEGIAPGKRKDAKLKRVIINEKRIKGNTKYLASQLPFPFETKEQYERSLRLPQGPEWTTKKTFQDATKPRLLVKQGIIRPMHKPLA
jgi:U3 small nucleolar RNA-associated protein 14